MENKKIKLSELLAVLFHTIEKANILFHDLFDGTYKMEIFDKGVNDKFTNIDWTVQKMIENNIHYYFPDLVIVGEEDTTKDLFQSDVLEIDKNIDLKWNLLNIPETIKELNNNQLKLYIDPVDATKNLIILDFIPVTILVGLTFNETPLLGIVNYPLYEGQKRSVFYFNIPSLGVYEYDLKSKNLNNLITPKNDNSELIIRENMKIEQDDGTKFVFFKKIINHLKVCRKFNNWNYILANGFGNKAILSLKKNAVFYFNLKSLGPWDTCAVHALCKENGGNLYKINGEEIIYNKELDSKSFNFTVVFFPVLEKKEKFFYIKDS